MSIVYADRHTVHLYEGTCICYGSLLNSVRFDMSVMLLHAQHSSPSPLLLQQHISVQKLYPPPCTAGQIHENIWKFTTNKLLHLDLVVAAVVQG